MTEPANQQGKVTIDTTYQTGVSFYDFVWSYLQQVVPEGEALAVETAKVITAEVATLGDIAMGAAEDRADRLNGAARGAVSSLGAAYEADIGSWLGGFLGDLAGAPVSDDAVVFLSSVWRRE